jgi:hypothetical protein
MPGVLAYANETSQSEPESMQWLEKERMRVRWMCRIKGKMPNYKCKLNHIIGGHRCYRYSEAGMNHESKTRNIEINE